MTSFFRASWRSFEFHRKTEFLDHLCSYQQLKDNLVPWSYINSVYLIWFKRPAIKSHTLILFMLHKRCLV